MVFVVVVAVVVFVVVSTIPGSYDGVRIISGDQLIEHFRSVRGRGFVVNDAVCGKGEFRCKREREEAKIPIVRTYAQCA